MTLETRIAALKTKLAGKRYPDSNTGEVWDGMEQAAFIAGADALAEVYRLEGQIIQIENYGEKGGSIWEATKYKLEALLKQMEDGK